MRFCEFCGVELKPLFNFLYCINDCDKLNKDKNHFEITWKDKKYLGRFFAFGNNKVIQVSNWAKGPIVNEYKYFLWWYAGKYDEDIHINSWAPSLYPGWGVEKLLATDCSPPLNGRLLAMKNF